MVSERIVDNEDIEALLLNETSELTEEKQLINYDQNTDEKILFMLLKRETDEIDLRSRITTVLLTIMAIQIILINTVIILMGCGVLSFNNLEPLRWLFTFVIAEVIGFITLIVKYLFKSDGTHSLNLLSKYIDRYQSKTQMLDFDHQVDFGA